MSNEVGIVMAMAMGSGRKRSRGWRAYCGNHSLSP